MTTAIEQKLPKQVQAAAAKARQILDEQKVQRDPAKAPAGAVLIENTEVPIPSLNGNGKGGNEPPPADPVTLKEGQNVEYWWHRARTLDGALSATKQKHAAKIVELQTQIDSLRAELRDAKEAVVAAAPVKLEDFFSAEEIETLGREEATIMATKIAAAQRNAVKAVRAETQAAAPSPTPTPPAPAPAAATDDGPSEEDEFFNELDRLVPHWEKINKDPRWKNHCGTIDPSTGLQVQKLLDAARESLNAPAAAKLFENFEASLHVVNPPPPPPAPSGRNAGGRDSAPPAPPVSANGKPNQAEITEHFKNRKLYFAKPDHPKHVSEAAHREFLARLQNAA